MFFFKERMCCFCSFRGRGVGRLTFVLIRDITAALRQLLCKEDGMRFAKKPDFEGVFNIYAHGREGVPAGCLTSDDLSQYCYSVLTVSEGTDWMVVKMRRAAFELYWQVADYLPERYGTEAGAWQAVVALSEPPRPNMQMDKVLMELADIAPDIEEEDTPAAQRAEIIKQNPRKRRDKLQVSL